MNDNFDSVLVNINKKTVVLVHKVEVVYRKIGSVNFQTDSYQYEIDTDKHLENYR